MKTIFSTIFYVCCVWVSGFTQVIIPTMEDSVIMRDGKKLVADIYIPDNGSGNKYPVILIQTPYNRKLYRLSGLPLGIKNNITASAYAFVIVDWRCFYGSSGACVAQPDRGKDGYDLVEWIALQSWSNGKTGTWGPSALGKIQFQTAKEQPPHLVCAVPLVAGPQYSYQEYFPGGVYRTEYVEQLDALGYNMSSSLLANPMYNSTWQYLESSTFYPGSIHVPVFMIGGWYDHNTIVILDFFNGLRQSSPSSVKDKHRLLMGPWAHGGSGTAQVGTAQQGELYYYDAEGWSDSLALAFLDFHLRTIPNGWESSPVVRYFQMGENQWNGSPAWPVNDVTNKNLYFHAGGELLPVLPSSLTEADTIIYDPRNPSPTVGGATLRQDLLQGPYNQAPVVESRDDILIFSTAALPEKTVMRGHSQVHLFVSSNRRDTDFSIRLTDVYPDGRSMLLAEGIRRLRFRNGFSAADTASALPGQIYPLVIELPDIANTFLPGHRIRIDVSGSNYPRYDRNLNNGGKMYSAGDTLIAENILFLNQQNASFIQLPLLGFPSTSKEYSATLPLFEIYPNPVAENTKPSLITTLSGKLTIDLINNTGQTVKKIQYQKTNDNSGSIPIDISNLPSGLYFVKLYGNEKISTGKLVIY